MELMVTHASAAQPTRGGSWLARSLHALHSQAKTAHDVHLTVGHTQALTLLNRFSASNCVRRAFTALMESEGSPPLMAAFRADVRDSTSSIRTKVRQSASSRVSCMEKMGTLRPGQYVKAGWTFFCNLNIMAMHVGWCSTGSQLTKQNRDAAVWTEVRASAVLRYCVLQTVWEWQLAIVAAMSPSGCAAHTRAGGQVGKDGRCTHRALVSCTDAAIAARLPAHAHCSGQSGFLLQWPVQWSEPWQSGLAASPLPPVSVLASMVTSGSAQRPCSGKLLQWWQGSPVFWQRGGRPASRSR